MVEDDTAGIHSRGASELEFGIDYSLHTVYYYGNLALCSLLYLL